MGLPSEVIEAQVLARGLIGFNVHYYPETGQWNVWTCHKNTGGWSISGRHDELDKALAEVILPIPAEEEDDSWEDLI